MLYCLRMAIVEQLVYRWADKITVERDGDKLFVYGQNGITEVWTESESRAVDILGEYRDAPRIRSIAAEFRSGLRAPHIRFANAVSEEKIVEFVRTYGPINGLREAWKALPQRKYAALTVIESLQRIRRERMLFLAVLKLSRSLLSKTEDIEGIRNALADMAHSVNQPGAEWERDAERKWHGTEYGFFLSQFALDVDGGWPSGVRLDDFLRGLKATTASECGWQILCRILNAFPPKLVPKSRGVVEIPPHERRGILAALYFMLRVDVLRRNKIGTCEQRDCLKYFRTERYGQRFCSADCSRLHRQRDYWQRKGKEARTLRVAAKRQKKGRKKRGTL